MSFLDSNLKRQYHGLPSEIRLMIWRLLMPSEPIAFQFSSSRERHNSASSIPQGSATSFDYRLQRSDHRHLAVLLRLNQETRLEVQELYRNYLSFDFTLARSTEEQEYAIDHMAPMLMHIARSIVIIPSVCRTSGIDQLIHLAGGRKSFTLVWLVNSVFAVRQDDALKCVLLRTETMRKIVEEIATGQVQELNMVCCVTISQPFVNPRMSMFSSGKSGLEDLEEVRDYEPAYVKRIEWSQNWMVPPPHGTEMNYKHRKDLADVGFDVRFLQGISPTHVGIFRMKRY